MAIRLADSFVEGWFYNTSLKSTHGVIVLEGLECPISLQLTGDAGESLHGRGFSFQRAEAEEPPVPLDVQIFPQQIGVTGTMELRMAKVPVGDYLDAYEQKRPIDYAWLPCLYLEWYGPNGRVVLELANPLITLDQGPPFADPEYPGDTPGSSTLEVTEIRQNEDGSAELRKSIPKPDFMKEDGEGHEDLDSYLDRLNAEREARMHGEEAPSSIDAELAWGETIIFSDDSDYLANILEPEKLPAADDVDEARAKTLVYSILTQLAMYHVAVHLCHHCTWRQAYAYILNEVLFESRVPREIVHTGWTMNHSYGESCPECEKEILEEFEGKTED